MYIIAHEDDCEMVLGNIFDEREYTHDVPGFPKARIKVARGAPARCTCDPTLYPLEYVPPDPKLYGLAGWKIGKSTTRAELRRERKENHVEIKD